MRKVAYVTHGIVFRPDRHHSVDRCAVLSRDADLSCASVLRQLSLKYQLPIGHLLLSNVTSESTVVSWRPKLSPLKLSENSPIYDDPPQRTGV